MAATDEQSTAPEGRGVDLVPWIVALLERNAPLLDDLDVVALAFKWAAIELAVAYAPPASQISRVSLRGPQVAAAALVAVLAPARVAALGFTPAEVAGLIAAVRPADGTADDDTAASSWEWFAAMFAFWLKRRWEPAATVEGRRDPTAAVRFAVDEALASEIVSPALAPIEQIEATMVAAARSASAGLVQKGGRPRARRNGGLVARELVARAGERLSARTLVLEAVTRESRKGERAATWAKAADGRLVPNAPVHIDRLNADRARVNRRRDAERKVADSQSFVDPRGVLASLAFAKAATTARNAQRAAAARAGVAQVLAALRGRYDGRLVDAWRAHVVDGETLEAAAARAGVSQGKARYWFDRIGAAAKAGLRSWVA